MAKYTVELYEIVKAGQRVFDFPYEFYDEERKEEFEQKFINHFRFREIGCETVGRFQHYLKCKCDEVLPYYNMLFRTALIDYEKLINYYLTETLLKDGTKSSDVSGLSKVKGSSNDERTSNLDSETRRDENIDTNKKEDVTEKGDTSSNIKEVGENKNKLLETVEGNKNLTNNISNKKVESDTPTGLLTMENIKGNVYASKADIEDSTNTTIDNQKTTNNKTDDTSSNVNRTDENKSNISRFGDMSEETRHRATDEVNSTSKDLSNGSFNNDIDTNQSTNEKHNEKYSKVVSGNVGVRSDAEMLEKHIALQKTLTRIYTMFFNECEDLFMQIF